MIEPMEYATFITALPEKPKISVWLDERANGRSSTPKSFHCNHCGRVVFEYHSTVNLVVAGESEVIKGHGLIIQCNGSIESNGERRRCKTLYYIN